MKSTLLKNETVNTAPQVIDLFSGAGLLGYAFHKEGYNLVAAYEADATAAETHRRNLPGKVVTCDLSLQKPEGTCDVIIAGPPCQGFSSIGKKSKNDPRNALCAIIPDWAKKTGASFVVIENVPSFLKSSAWLKMANKFKRMGFQIGTWKLNAKDYGVAQNRMRSFTICSKGELPDLYQIEKEDPVTVRQALRGLPRYPNYKTQHFAREQSPQSLERISLIPEGGDIRNLAQTAPELVPPSWFKTKGKVIDIWGRLSWNGVSNTLRTGFLHPSRGRFLHPTQNRPISFREAARIQGLPDDFIFCGKAGQLARQIGNGVPTGLGRAVAKHIYKYAQSYRDHALARSCASNISL